ncbi:MAG: hypothetical protein H0W84_06655 [Bacteroidetes bacterium]|nr:hypothetical protein [Bacteroidota bacterium]
MKTKSKSSILLGIFLITLIGASSCKKEKDKQIPPEIAFKSGSAYVSSNANLTTNDTIVVGITANKTEDKDLLTRFVATQKYDAGSATTILNEAFSQDTYSKDIQIITRNVAGIEAYTFTIINRDGLTKTIALTFTVN